ncbi:MAG: metallophosphoesterase family protein [Phycisphaerales bacterium]
MARFAFISDIHSNLPAFEAVLTEIERIGVDTIICLGDVVGYGPHPVECLELVRKRCDFCVQGNHDLAVIDELEAGRFNLAARMGIEYTRDVIREEHARQIAEMPFIGDLDEVTVCHASPDPNAPTDYIHDQTVAAGAFGGFDSPCLIVGHTHVPAAFATRDMGYATVEPKDVSLAFLPPASALKLNPEFRYILNPGSVGQPRDGNPDASFAILEPDSRTFSVHRVPYNIAATQQAMREVGLPDMLAQRLRLGA